MHTTISSPEHLAPTGLLIPEFQQVPIGNLETSSQEAPTASTGAALAVGEIARSTDATQEHPRLRDRFCRSKVGRLAMTGLASLGLTGGAVIAETSPAIANPVYTVINPDKDDTKSVWDRNSPRMADTTRTYPDFSYYGDQLELICGANGEAVGPKNNRRWHYAKNLSRPEAGYTWIADRFMNTPNKANQPTPGEAECGAAASLPEAPKPVPAATACYFNIKAPSKNLTFSYEGDHRYLGNAYQAAKNWSNAGAGININHTDASNAYIRFKDVNITKPTTIQGMPADSNTLAVTVIPVSWQKEYSTTVPKNPHIPASVTILVNKYAMDNIPGDSKKKDFFKTYTLTHEAGHALGLAHPDQFCQQHPSASVMAQGDGDLYRKNYNTPMPFDKAELKQLYN
jgi:hypothetical protein